MDRYEYENIRVLEDHEPGYRRTNFLFGVYQPTVSILVDEGNPLSKFEFREDKSAKKVPKT